MVTKSQTSFLLKKHFSQVKPSATLQINERSAQLISEGKEVYRLGFGQSPFPVPKSVVNELKNTHTKKIIYQNWIARPAKSCC